VWTDEVDAVALQGKSPQRLNARALPLGKRPNAPSNGKVGADTRNEWSNLFLSSELERAIHVEANLSNPSNADGVTPGAIVNDLTP
jgi:hypothetical protein